MAENIINNMFNVDPDQLRQQRMQNLYTQSMQTAQLDPFQRANQAIMQGAGGAAMLGAQAMGMTTPEEQLIETRKSVLQGFDPSNIESIMASAQKLNTAGDTQGAMILAQHARDLEKQKVEEEYKKALTERALREPDITKIMEVGVAGKPDMRQKLVKQDDGTWEPEGEPYRVGKSASADTGMKPADELRWMNQHSKDYERASSVIDTSTDANRSVTSIKTNPKFGYVFGGYTEKALSKFAPGEIAGLQSEISTLKSNLMSSGLNLIKSANQAGIGSITEKEWPIFENMIANLDPKMDEKTARSKLDKIEAFFERTRQRSADLYDKKWKSKKDFYDPSIREIVKPKEVQNNLQQEPSGKKVVKWGDLK